MHGFRSCRSYTAGRLRLEIIFVFIIISSLTDKSYIGAVYLGYKKLIYIGTNINSKKKCNSKIKYKYFPVKNLVDFCMIVKFLKIFVETKTTYFHKNYLMYLGPKHSGCGGFTRSRQRLKIFLEPLKKIITDLYIS